MSQTTKILDGRYRLGRMLGQGGMSDVYEATDEQSGAAVAVKIVRAGDPELSRRVAQEARALERLDHPGLVRLLHAGLAGLQAYLVMQLVSGPTLARELRRGPLGPDRSAALGARLAGALAYVHQQGIVHRDVKPSNVLLTPDGQAQLGDFGIARFLDASALTVTGTTLGTAAYMAPEQLEDHQVGPEADIWSLGMVLLECLTGRRIYEGSASEVVARRLAGPVPLPPDLSAPWRLLLTGMLDHRPDQRLSGTEVAALLDTSPFHEPWVPSSATEAGALAPTVPHDLTALAPGPAATAVLAPDATVVLAPDATAVQGGPMPPSERVRRRRRWAVALAALLAAGLLIGLLLGLGGSPNNPPHHSAVNKSTTTTVAPTTTTTAAPTTTVPPAASALAALVGAVAAGESAGSVDQGDGQGISMQAQQAVSDAAAGKGSQAANDLQQAAMTIAKGVQKGKITQPEGTALQADLDALASALGLSAAATPPPSPPSP